jgi:hypothetical protein
MRTIPHEKVRTAHPTDSAETLGASRTLKSSAANRPQRTLFHRLLAPWNNHAVENPAKNGLAGADFRYRRPSPGGSKRGKPDRLLAVYRELLH